MPQRTYQLTGPSSSWAQGDPGPAQGESHRVSGDTKVVSQLGKRLTGQIQLGRFLGLPRPQPGRPTGQAIAPGAFCRASCSTRTLAASSSTGTPLA